MVGKLSEIISNAMHASRLRNSLSQLSVTEVISRVSRVAPDLHFPEKRRMVAARMVMPLLLAACIRMGTGIRSVWRRPKRLMTVRLAKQL